MSTLEDLDDIERSGKDDRKDEGDKDQDGKKLNAGGDAEMKDAQDADKDDDVLDADILNSSTRDIVARRRLLDNDMRIMKSEFQRLTHEKATMHEKIKDNMDKIENNRCAPWLSATHLELTRSTAGNYPTSSATSSRFSIWT